LLDCRPRGSRSPSREVRDAVGFLGEDPGSFDFVDLGCGKGRVLLVAANLGFKQVIGVEFARELAEIANQNFTKMKVTNAAVVHADAAEYQFPDSDLVVYLYNPFLPQVMKKVVANLKRSRAKRLFVIYSVPDCGSLFDVPVS
jgi:SAM-dependent methyltransferase